MLYDNDLLLHCTVMFNRMISSFVKPLESFSYLTEKSLWRYAAIPLALTAGIVVLFGAGLVIYLAGVEGSLPGLNTQDWPAVLRWLVSILGIVLKIIVLLLVFALLMRLFLLMFSIIVIPFMSPLVEKILVAEGVATLKVSGLEMIGFIFATIVYNVKMLIVQMLVALLLMLTGPLQPALNFFVSGYFVGRSYFDYVFELLGRPQQFAQMARGNRAEATGVGIFSNLFVFVPVVGAVLGPLLCVVAATRIYADKNFGKA
ncbi:MAG: EI24 domain-containing protein [Turneriella sp.]